MTKEEKLSILKKSKDFFKEEIVESHIKNTIKLNNINKFNINPFIHRYLAQFAFGNSDPKSLAKVLIYPRVLGTSINTTFGNKMQAYCGKVLSGNGSLVDGMDIEFIDCIDGKKKYCQIKAGPQTINKDDVTTIINHFSSAIRLSRTNNLNISSENCMVGVIYGEQKDLSNNYKKIDHYYPVYIGKEFWLHLTGDEGFYDKLILSFVEVAEEMDSSELLNNTIQELSKYFN